MSRTRRERIEAAVVAGGKSTRNPHEAWIAADPRGTVRVLMTGPDGFERSVGFGPDEDTVVITEFGAGFAGGLTNGPPTLGTASLWPLARSVPAGGSKNATGDRDIMRAFDRALRLVQGARPAFVRVKRNS